MHRIVSGPHAQTVPALSRNDLMHKLMVFSVCLALAPPAMAATDSTNHRSSVCVAKSNENERGECIKGLLQTWIYSDSKSPIDDSPEFSAMKYDPTARGSDPVAVTFRCSERKEEFVISTQGYWGSNDGLSVTMRINGSPAATQKWHAATTGEAVFAPDTVLRILEITPDDGTMFVRIADFRGETHDATFKLNGFDQVRAKVVATCQGSK
jgi:hypothetical protein